MSEAHDPRITPVRDDLAAAKLEGVIERPRYVEGVARQVASASLPLSFSACHQARLESELLLGEDFTVYDEASGWAWGQAARDGYVGWVPAADLRSEIVRMPRLSAISSRIPMA